MQSLFSRVCPVAEVGPEDELAEPGLAKARELAEVRWASQSCVSVVVQVRPDMKPGEPALDEATAKRVLQATVELQIDLRGRTCAKSG